MRPTVWMALLALVVGAPASGDSTFGTGELRSHIEYLASDALEGRDTGAPGIKKAETYVAGAFREYGLKPLPGEKNYFVDFTLYRQGYDGAGTRMSIDAGRRGLRAKAGVDFRPFSFSDAGEIEAEVVFAGYGVTAPDLEYDDYAGLDVEGKIVFVLRHEPNERDPESPFNGTETTDHATFTTKARTASDHGAIGMVLVTDPLNHEPGDDLRLGGRLRLERPAEQDEEGGVDPFLAVQISRELADRMLQGSGKTLGDLQTAVDGEVLPAELALPSITASLGVRPSARAETVAARNVVGFLEGSDPVLKKERIVIGGHHDHLGAFSGSGDTVFNGADDNASGVSGVLELARAFAALPSRPPRSLVFVTFSAEEKGLLGSKALVEEVSLALDDVVFMLNLDMIGRNGSERVRVFGDGYARGLRETVELANDQKNLVIDFAATSYAGNSDHDPFYRNDIPFLFFFTGTHEDYHQLSDHADKIDFEQMRRILQTAFGLVDRIARAEQPPGFIHHVSWLGMQVEVLAEDGPPAAVVTGVDLGSRASENGFATGDRLIAFDGEPLGDPARIGEILRGIEPGSTTSMGVRRGTEEMVLEVRRARTGYMGVLTAGVDEDRRRSAGLGPGDGVLLRQVVDDGPSDKAGLRAGDVVLTIAGRPVGRDSLRSVLSQIGAGEKVELTIVRDDERLTLPLVLGQRPG